MAQFWRVTYFSHSGSKCSRGGRGGEFNHTYTFPSRWKSRNKWQSGRHPLPRDKCDFQSHLIAQKCTAERSAFRRRQNDLGDISDSRGDAPSLSVLMYAVAVNGGEKDRKKRRWRYGEIKKWGEKAVYWYRCKFSPGQLWQKWMIFIKSLGFVSSISYISPNGGRPSLYRSERGSATLLSFSRGVICGFKCGKLNRAELWILLTFHIKGIQTIIIL